MSLAMSGRSDGKSKLNDRKPPTYRTCSKHYCSTSEHMNMTWTQTVKVSKQQPCLCLLPQAQAMLAPQILNRECCLQFRHGDVNHTALQGEDAEHAQIVSSGSFTFESWILGGPRGAGCKGGCKLGHLQLLQSC